MRACTSANTVAVPDERDIERRLVYGVRARGGIAYKFVSPGRRGVPDRLVLTADGAPVVFVELKAPGGRLRPEQEREHRRLQDMGYEVHVLASYEDVDSFLEGL